MLYFIELNEFSHKMIYIYLFLNNVLTWLYKKQKKLNS